MSPFVVQCNRYAENVLSGELKACKWTKAACQRYLDDMGDKVSEFRFDELAAARVCEFGSMLPHIRGEWAKRKEKIKLEDFQCFILCNLFGWVRKRDGLRRFRTLYLEIARKNAKSTLLAIICLYMLTADGEAGPEVYSAATTRKQASIVFNVGRSMAVKEPDFRNFFGVEVPANAVTVPIEDGIFEAVSSEAGTLDGKNVHCAGVDELHAHKTAAVWDVLETATGARAQPLIAAISTSGSNTSGICYQVRSYLAAILNKTLRDNGGLGYPVVGEVVENGDDSVFGIIYTIDDNDEWDDEAIWIKANPNLGVSVKLDDLQRKAKKARFQSSALANFKTKHLDVWVSSDQAWMDMQAWARAARPSLTVDNFVGCRCFVGLDLASKFDFASRVLLFERPDGTAHLFSRHFLPEEAVEDADNASYSGWVDDGWIEATEGNVLDAEAVLDDIREISKYSPTIGYDPGYGWDLIQRAEAEVGEMVKVSPSVMNFSEPMKELEGWIASGKLTHDGNPVTTWMFSHVVAHQSGKDNIYPRKAADGKKIDGVIAAIIASYVRLKSGDSESVYAHRGVIEV